MGTTDAVEAELGVSVWFSVIYIVSFLLWIKASAKIIRNNRFGPFVKQGPVDDYLKNKPKVYELLRFIGHFDKYYLGFRPK